MRLVFMRRETGNGGTEGGCCSRRAHESAADACDASRIENPKLRSFVLAGDGHPPGDDKLLECGSSLLARETASHWFRCCWKSARLLEISAEGSSARDISSTHSWPPHSRRAESRAYQETHSAFDRRREYLAVCNEPGTRRGKHGEMSCYKPLPRLS